MLDACLWYTKVLNCSEYFYIQHKYIWYITKNSTTVGHITRYPKSTIKQEQEVRRAISPNSFKSYLYKYIDVDIVWEQKKFKKSLEIVL